jgi:hypothetical protein
MRTTIKSSVIAVLILVAQPTLAFASDTPSLGQGDCWQPTTPYTCRSSWNTAGVIYFRAIDQFSSIKPSYKTPATNAINAWNSAPGPQFYSFTARSGDTWIYLHAITSGQHGLTSSMYGLTWNCSPGGYCSDVDETNYVGWTDVYLNYPKIDAAVAGGSTTIVQETVAHESGHGMLLAHNTTNSGSLMWPSVNGVTVPKATEWGVFPGCSSGGHGTRCIYEQT